MQCVCDTCNTHKDDTKHIILILIDILYRGLLFLNIFRRRLCQEVEMHGFLNMLRKISV